ncbi:hypothetical protein BDN70DRAFT_16417 [Pholiota conissans]|uniref:Uncharacterized protein n=1 Tax=Pholiota conissans TaxID=109636 RepID=A0A9P6D7C5_9AGAR|nr:hypothetical protein BDN70DRAFT_16417 [Pholiota conissans]
MSMTCCSTFVSGFAAVVAMFAFIFDLVLFFVAKSRINAVGSAQIGNAVWLTLAAWLLLFFSGCFYTLGRCCISSRPRAPTKGGWMNKGDTEAQGPDKNYSEQMRLDAVKAEADRKARQKQGSETGLPAFYEAQPLTGHVDGDQVYVDNDHEHDSQTHIAGAAAPMAGRAQGYSNGYVAGAPGSRTIDEYYAGPSQPQTPSSNTYPPHREPSAYAPSTYSANTRLSPRPQQSMPGQDNYGASPYAAYNNAAATPAPAQPSAMLAIPGQYPQERDYGHTAGGSSCVSK